MTRTILEGCSGVCSTSTGSSLMSKQSGTMKLPESFAVLYHSYQLPETSLSSQHQYKSRAECSDTNMSPCTSHIKPSRRFMAGVTSCESWIIIQSCLNVQPNYLWRPIQSMHIEFALDGHQNNVHSCEHNRSGSNAHLMHIKVPKWKCLKFPKAITFMYNHAWIILYPALVKARVAYSI